MRQLRHALRQGPYKGQPPVRGQRVCPDLSGVPAPPRNHHPSILFGEFVFLRRNWFEDTLLDDAGMAQFLRRFFQKQFNRYKNQMNRARTSKQDGISSGATEALGYVEKFSNRVVRRALGDLNRTTRAECPTHSTKV